jgi:hypothetical protein
LFDTTSANGRLVSGIFSFGKKLVPKIMEYAEKQCPEDALHDAWDDYYGLGTKFE